MDILFHLDFWLSLLVLTLLEITLSADNIIFIVAASSRLPKQQQALARKIGLIGAASTRVIFLSMLFFATTLIAPLFYIGTRPVSINTFVLIFGGLFLIINPFLEIRELRAMKAEAKRKNHAKFSLVILQIMFVDIVFSIDNVITAIGVTKSYIAMVTAIVIATIFMFAASNVMTKLVDRYPKLKVIGLSFLVLIGAILMIRGFGYEISSTYIYVPFLFAAFTQSMLVYARLI